MRALRCSRRQGELTNPTLHFLCIISLGDTYLPRLSTFFCFSCSFPALATFLSLSYISASHVLSLASNYVFNITSPLPPDQAIFTPQVCMFSSLSLFSVAQSSCPSHHPIPFFSARPHSTNTFSARSRHHNQQQQKKKKIDGRLISPEGLAPYPPSTQPPPQAPSAPTPRSRRRGPHSGTLAPLIRAPRPATDVVNQMHGRRSGPGHDDRRAREHPRGP